MKVTCVMQQGKLPPGSQTHFRSIVTDEHLQVSFLTSRCTSKP